MFDKSGRDQAKIEILAGIVRRLPISVTTTRTATKIEIDDFCAQIAKSASTTVIAAKARPLRTPPKVPLSKPTSAPPPRRNTKTITASS